ncbi:MAG: glycosyltransferase [Candidatus Omnitrophica bacterium]|nr:glycosyltransferase [Candidatus Omnitrophota bacterium]
MKIIIAYASAGRGHQTAAESVYNCLKVSAPQAEVKIIDILSHTKPGFSSFYSKGYSFLASHLTPLWAVLFFITNNAFVRKALNSLSRRNCKSFSDLLTRENPDAIVVTHFFPADAVSYLKAKNKITSRLITVITDFGVHPLWLSQKCDDYIVASEYTKEKLLLLGLAESKIKVFGIPIRTEFSSAKKAAGSNSSALLITGSFGFSFIEKMAEELQTMIKLTVVCGNNKELYAHLKSKNYSGLDLYGFTDQIPRIMSEVDFIITKPGGLSIAEALAMELPMILIRGIPGQETENAKIMIDSGCALEAKDTQEVKDIVRDWKNNPDKLNRVRQNIQKIKKPDSTQELCKYVRSSSPGPSG